MLVIVFMGAFGRGAGGAVRETCGVNGVIMSGVGFGLGALART
jgi:hypothetical protein